MLVFQVIGGGAGNPAERTGLKTALSTWRRDGRDKRTSLE